MSLCERIKEANKRKKYTEADIMLQLQMGKVAWIGDFSVTIILMEATLMNPDIRIQKLYKNNFYMSFDRYFTKPLIFYVSKNINPQALKFINRRLGYSFIVKKSYDKPQTRTFTNCAASRVRYLKGK